MRRFLTPALLASSIAMLFAPHGASAAVMLYSDRPTFLAHAGSVTTYGFEIAEGFPDAAGGSPYLSSFAGGTITTAVPAGRARVERFPTSTTNQVLSEVSFLASIFAPTPLTLKFNPVREVVGFDLYLPQTTETATITVAFGDDTTSVFPLADNDANTSTPIFWGVVSDVPIRQVTTSGQYSTLSGMPTLLDKVATDVPEPAGLAVAGLTMLAGRRRAREYGRRA